MRSIILSSQCQLFFPLRQIILKIKSKNDSDIVIGINNFLDENANPGSYSIANNLKIFIKMNQIRKLHLELNLIYLSFYR